MINNEISKENIEDIYGLSSMQKSMLFNHAIDPSSSAYTEQFDFCIKGDVKPKRMEWALIEIVKRYEIFRTVFSYRKTDEPRQVLLKSRLPEWLVKDFSYEATPEKLVEEFKEDDRKRGFDLSKDVLVRGALLKIGREKWHFIFSFHHIVMDGWSLAPLLEELFNLYESDKEEVNTNTGKPSFRDYIQWLENQDESKAQNYWKNYLTDYEKKASIPEYNTTDSYKHATHKFQLPDSLVERMNGLSLNYKITVNTIFQTAWGILLQRYNYTDDVVFGNVVSGRTSGLEGVESIKGLFINTLPLRVRTEENDTFVSLCRKVQNDIFVSSVYEYYPLYEIQGLSQLKNSLLDHVIAFENYPLSERLQMAGGDKDNSLHIDKVKVFESTNYNFNIVVNPGQKFMVSFIYNSNLYSQKTIGGLENTLVHSLEMACSNPKSLVKELSICSNTYRNLILEQLNPKDVPYPSDTTVDKVFDDVAAQFPDKTALIYREERITYKELNLWAHQLALHLKEKGVGPNTTVGIVMPRCHQLVIAAIGILKLGGAYLPMDISNSLERLKFMMDDSDIKVICTLGELSEKVPPGYDVVYLDQIQLTDDINSIPIEKFNTQQDASSHFYTIYTSGSTGKPKGCKITHRNVLRLLFAQDYIDFGAHQVILQSASPAFDASVFEIWGALLHGGTLVIATEQDILNSARLKKMLTDFKVQSLLFTPVLFNRLCDEDTSLFSKLKNLIVGGDALSVPHIKKVMTANPDLNVVNAYGPTENSVMATAHKITEEDLEGERIPIGKPLMNSKVYILDKGLKLLPIGAVGEICAGGDGVGLGYHKRSSLTEKLFIEDPFIQGATMYRTGDMARWRPDGTIDFLGRIDSQVKIRGYRIELGEIESVMMNLLNLKQVIVQVKEVGHDKQLCAYFTESIEYNVEKWKETLASILPEYMIPVFFTKLREFPVTPNGKIDYKALPTPEIIQVKFNKQKRPHTEVEKKLVEICASVLGLDKDKIDPNAKLFEIGANSLSMITINTRLKEAFNRDIPLTTLFEHSTIDGIAAYLQKEETDTKPENEEDDVNMTNERIKLLKRTSIIRRMEGN